VLYHHERWDGGGYPTGRSGEDIPEEARLLAVADAFDAMTSMRPYRRALPIAAAVQEVERCAGSQFDPTVAQAFLEAWSAGALEATAAAS
jgi:HD-GYP domain-containing protein (c-di-GMP phosphodiesterase class II)